MARYHDHGRHHGAVLAMGGLMVCESGFGPVDITWGIPNEPDVKNDIGSVTKPVFVMVGAGATPGY